MPIYMDGELIWVDATSAFTLDYEVSILAVHLQHVMLLLDGGYEQSNTGLFMPCGDVFQDGSTVMYRINQFGANMLIMNYKDTELVMPVTSELRAQLSLLIGALSNE